ncbi:MAG: hypothetical protein HRF49_05460 [bacterium]
MLKKPVLVVVLESIGQLVAAVPGFGYLGDVARRIGGDRRDVIVQVRVLGYLGEPSLGVERVVEVACGV